MLTIYTIKSLNELADFFDTLASDQRATMKYNRTIREKAEAQGKIDALEDAARIIRNTRLVTEA